MFCIFKHFEYQSIINKKNIEDIQNHNFHEKNTTSMFCDFGRHLSSTRNFRHIRPCRAGLHSYHWPVRIFYSKIGVSCMKAIQRGCIIKYIISKLITMDTKFKMDNFLFDLGHSTTDFYVWLGVFTCLPNSTFWWCWLEGLHFKEHGQVIYSRPYQTTVKIGCPRTDTYAKFQAFSCMLKVQKGVLLGKRNTGPSWGIHTY